MMNYPQYTCEEFVRALASDASTPGGGGASALVASLGVALANMVGSLTVGRKRYQAAEEEVLRLKQSFTALQSKLLSLMDDDAVCFTPLLNAYKLPVRTEAEQARKALLVEAGSVTACMVPLSIMECCCEALPLIARIVEIGSVMAVSDAGCAASFCRAALESAALNVLINTGNMKDREQAEQLNAYTRQMLDTYLPMGEEIFSSVRSALQKK